MNDGTGGGIVAPHPLKNGLGTPLGHFFRDQALTKARKIALPSK